MRHDWPATPPPGYTMPGSGRHPTDPSTGTWQAEDLQAWQAATRRELAGRRRVARERALRRRRALRHDRASV